MFCYNYITIIINNILLGWLNLFVITPIRTHITYPVKQWRCLRRPLPFPFPCAIRATSSPCVPCGATRYIGRWAAECESHCRSCTFWALCCSTQTLARLCSPRPEWAWTAGFAGEGNSECGRLKERRSIGIGCFRIPQSSSAGNWCAWAGGLEAEGLSWILLEALLHTHSFQSRLSFNWFITWLTMCGKICIVASANFKKCKY